MYSNIILKSKRIVTPKGILDGYILIKDNKIYKITNNIDNMKFEGEYFDFKNNLLIPGFIDLHIHGAGGNTVMGESKEIHSVAEYLAENGTTSFYATTSTVSKDNLLEAINNITKAIESQRECSSEIIGIHLEGPFVNVERKGAFTPKFILQSSMKVMKELEEACVGYLRRVTLAPEIPNSLEIIQYLCEKGYLVAGGHTNATYEKTMAGISTGVRIANHMFNAMRGLHHRKPGAAGAYLLSKNVYCEIIGDFIHVHPAVIELILRCKGIDKTYLISDAIIAAGLEPGEYQFVERRIIVEKNGISHLADGTIAGSTYLMKDGFKNIVEKLNYSVEEAVKLTSENPAKVAGVYNRKGSLTEGKDADIVVFDNEYNIECSLVRGKMVKNNL